ncbi:MAG TPA: hypothetical protein VLK65_09545 [Vicinamibacteria bacterium]|nr:hypothetical protein [Vicinamibacteria bacterium]
MEEVGDPSLGWYLETFPGGGIMLWAEGFGSVFLTRDNFDDFDDLLEFVSRDVGAA